MILHLGSPEYRNGYGLVDFHVVVALTLASLQTQTGQSIALGQFQNDNLVVM